jgi:hypothetical protein
MSLMLGRFREFIRCNTLSFLHKIRDEVARCRAKLEVPYQEFL